MRLKFYWLVATLLGTQLLLTACAHDDHLPTGDQRKYGDGEQMSKAENTTTPHHYSTSYPN